MGNIEIRTDDVNKPEKDYVLEFVNIDQLVPHEMVIRSALDDFKTQVEKMGYLMRPILVDVNSNLILDGHHRQKGLSELGYIQAPVIMIDYMDESEITLDTWYPLVNFDLDRLVKRFSPRTEIKVSESFIFSPDLPNYTLGPGSEDTFDDQVGFSRAFRNNFGVRNWLVNPVVFTSRT